MRGGCPCGCRRQRPDPAAAGRAEGHATASRHAHVLADGRRGAHASEGLRVEGERREGTGGTGGRCGEAPLPPCVVGWPAGRQAARVGATGLSAAVTAVEGAAGGGGAGGGDGTAGREGHTAVSLPRVGGGSPLEGWAWSLERPLRPLPPPLTGACMSLFIAGLVRCATESPNEHASGGCGRQGVCGLPPWDVAGRVRRGRRTVPRPRRLFAVTCRVSRWRGQATRRSGLKSGGGPPLTAGRGGRRWRRGGGRANWWEGGGVGG